MPIQSWEQSVSARHGKRNTEIGLLKHVLGMHGTRHMPADKEHQCDYERRGVTSMPDRLRLVQDTLYTIIQSRPVQLRTKSMRAKTI